MVASGHPLASLAGIDALRAGGNAVDAAIAMSAVMAVVQPYSSHLGGDAFALIRTAAGDTVALNAGGRAPRAATPDQYASGIPVRGAKAVAVPGMVDAICAMHARFGTKPLRTLLAPAVDLARDGFAVSAALSRTIRGAEELLAGDAGCREAFLRDGAPQAGSELRQPDLAGTLEAIGEGGREAFYEGEMGAKIVSCLRENGGLLAGADMSDNQAVWGEPLTIRYRDWVVHGQPLPSQGFVTLEALKIIEQFDLGAHGMLSAEAVHPAVEAIRLAFDDRDAHAGDPHAVAVPIERLLSKEYAAAQCARIGPRSSEARPAAAGDTTSFAVADAQGNLVSFIQSIFQVWGAAVLVPGTGVLLNDRILGFSLDPASANLLRPGMRTVHTLNTWLLERVDGPIYAGGTPGADTQVQVNLQVISALTDRGLGPQAAIDAPKWGLTAHRGRPLVTTVDAGGGLALESRFPQETPAELRERGHTVVWVSAWEGALSRCQIVGRDAGGALQAASDRRSEGCALGW